MAGLMCWRTLTASTSSLRACEWRMSRRRSQFLKSSVPSVSFPGVTAKCWPPCCTSRSMPRRERDFRYHLSSVCVCVYVYVCVCMCVCVYVCVCVCMCVYFLKINTLKTIQNHCNYFYFLL